MAKAKKVLVDVVASGRAGGRARVARLSAAELAESSSNAARARWDAYYAANPEKLAAKLDREARKGRKRGRPLKAARKKGAKKP
jgi:hypothetical protein